MDFAKYGMPEEEEYGEALVEVGAPHDASLHEPAAHDTPLHDSAAHDVSLSEPTVHDASLHESAVQHALVGSTTPPCLLHAMSSLTLDEDGQTMEALLLPPINRETVAGMDISVVKVNVRFLHQMFLDDTSRLTVNHNDMFVAAEHIYWDQVEDDVVVLAAKLNSGQRAKCPPRLKILLKTIRGIAGDVYPDTSKFLAALYDFFDVDIIVQEIEAGQFDLALFTKCFCQALQAVCAPKRDRQLAELTEAAERLEIVKVLRGFLEILEAMKMDILNWDLLKLQKDLAADLPKIEADFFEHECKGVYANTKKVLDAVATHEPDESAFGVFANALVKYTLEKGAIHAETFILDEEVISNLRTGAQDLCIVASAIGMFLQIVGRSRGALEVPTLKARLLAMLGDRQTEVFELAALLMVSIRAVSPSIALDLTELTHQLDNLVRPTSPVFKMLEARLSKYMIDTLYKRTAKVPSGFAELAKQMAEFGQRFGHLGQVNWLIHSATYTRLHRQ